MFKRVAIIGVGLIGGSLGLSLKRKRLAGEVIGFFRKKRSARLALKSGIVDQAVFNLKNAVKDADLVILATPVGVIKSIAPTVITQMQRRAFLMDVGSTKQEVMRSIEGLISSRKIEFIGTHPLAGSEKSGLLFAQADLFHNSVCFVVPSRYTSPQALAKAQRFWRVLGAKTILIDALTHDRIVATVSHLPHIISFALMNCLPADLLHFAGSGLKDATRLASSESRMWTDICLSNKNEILRSLKRFKTSLTRLESLIRQKSPRLLQRYFLQAKVRRDNL